METTTWTRGTNTAAGVRTLGSLIDAYLMERHIGGLAKRTLESYSRTLSDLLVHTGDVSPASIGPAGIRAYFARAFDRGCGKNTLALYHTHLNIFFSWLIDCEMITTNPMHKIPKPRKDKPLPRFLDPGQVNKLLAHCGGAYNGERLRAIILTFMGTGIRCSELCGLDVSDLNMGEGSLRVRNGKGGRDRMIPIDPNLNPIYKQWLNVRARYLRGRASRPLFVTRVYRRPARDNIYDQIRNVGQRAGVTPISPHTLRHTFATMYVANGGSLLALKEILGHKSLNTTQIYLHTSAKMIQLDLFKASPLRKLERDRLFPVIDL